MILADLNKYISEMNFIKDLEQNSNDLQKQEKNNKAFKNVVSEIYEVIEATNKAYLELSFKISLEQNQSLINLIEKCNREIVRGQVQEGTISSVQKELNAIKKAILKEWTEEYKKISSHKISMLQNVKGITSEPDKINYAINKIKRGANWEFKNEALDILQLGIEESDEIIKNLELIDEVTEFLNKVSGGKATILDLTPVVLKWIMDKGMSEKFSISCK